MASLLFKLRLLDPNAAGRPLSPLSARRSRAPSRNSHSHLSVDRSNQQGRSCGALRLRAAGEQRQLAGAFSRGRGASVPERGDGAAHPSPSGEGTSRVELAGPTPVACARHAAAPGIGGSLLRHTDSVHDYQRESQMDSWRDSDYDHGFCRSSLGGASTSRDTGDGSVDGVEVNGSADGRADHGHSSAGFDPAARGGVEMSRATAPATPMAAPGGDLASAAPWCGRTTGGWSASTTGQAAGHGGRRNRCRHMSVDVPPSVPRIRRVATVCGGDRFEFVQQQANEFLQLLLVMDVRRSGRISYDEWARGVLTLPDVLSCFQLAISTHPPTPSPGPKGRCKDTAASPADAAGEGVVIDFGSRGLTAVCGPGQGAGQPSAPVVTGVAVSTATALWWRSVWRSVTELTCAGCSTR